MAKKRTIAKPAKRTPTRDQRRVKRKPSTKAKPTRTKAVKSLRGEVPAAEEPGEAEPLSLDILEERVRYVVRQLLESLLRVMAVEAYAPQGDSKHMPGNRPSPHQVTDYGVSFHSSTNDELLSVEFAEPASTPTVSDGRVADGNGPDNARATNDPQVVTSFFKSDVSADGDAALDDAMARALLGKINMVSEAARAKYTALFYLRELGARGAFSGTTITLASLPGENQETKRTRIWWLKNEGAVASQSRNRLEKVSLTPLGKRVWDLYRIVVPVHPTAATQ